MTAGWSWSCEARHGRDSGGEEEEGDQLGEARIGIGIGSVHGGGHVVGGVYSCWSGQMC